MLHMKLTHQLLNARACLAVVALFTLLVAITASAATSVLPSQIVLRPLTPGDVSAYKLPSTTEVSGGLNNVGVGTAVYLEAEVSSTIAASNIVSVTWSLTATPPGSAAAFTNSPLGANVPVYSVSDRSRYQVAGRTLLRPDVAGQYTVVANIVMTGSGSTNLSKTITAGTYLGANTCALCHSGSVAAEDTYHPWTTTAHSMIFSNGICGYLGSYSSSCLKCHTVGYNTTASAVNGGFDDVMTQTGWKFPTSLSPTNWAAMPSSLQNVGNIQCENCHGPGSQHAYSLGNTNLITRTVDSGDCNQCHDAPTHHTYGTQWYASRHALTTGPTSANCMGCHSANGFIARMSGETFTNQTFASISCQTCHEPHGATTPTNNPHLLRVLGSVTMPDGTVVTNAGFGALCLQCHQVRNGSATNQIVKYPLGQPTWFGGSSFGAHDGPQGDMIEGVNAHTYGQNIPSSAHRTAVEDLCVGCHMQPAAYGDPAYLQAGGHTFGMTYNVVTNGVTNTLDKVDVCVQCHGSIASFDMPRGDFNGDGVIEGVQTEVKHLLDTLSMLLPNSSGVVDGLVKTSMSFKTNWSQQFLKAGYNWQFVNNDGSFGVHNAPFAVGILKASMADLLGKPSATGSLSPTDIGYYKWQIQYFGSASNPNADPNASPAGDGVPNWVKYSLNLNPMISGTTNDLGGMVWVNGTDIPGTAANTVQIFKAAEVAFDTEVGKTYYVQGESSLSSGWQNISGPIAGTGTTVSYLTPTRKDVQQYFRVVHNP
jgi:hypothetical protein